MKNVSVTKPPGTNGLLAVFFTCIYSHDSLIKYNELSRAMMITKIKGVVIAHDLNN